MKVAACMINLWGSSFSGTELCRLWQFSRICFACSGYKLFCHFLVLWHSVVQSGFSKYPWKAGETAKTYAHAHIYLMLSQFSERNKQNRSERSWRRCVCSSQRWKRRKILLRLGENCHKYVTRIICHTFMEWRNHTIIHSLCYMDRAMNNCNISYE